MPRFLAYVCPRTEQVFKDKSTYVTHLRGLARESLTAKDIARKTHELRLDFAKLRVSATSELDVLNWLLDNSASVIRAACVIRPELAGNLLKMEAQAADRGFRYTVMSMNHLEVGRQVDVDIKIPFVSKYNHPSLAVGSTSLLPVVRGRVAYLEAIEAFLSDMLGVKSYFGGKNDLYVHMYAEDWTFVAEKALYAHRRKVDDMELGYSLERVISRRFPHVTFEGYRGLCESQLLEDDMLGEPALTNWLRHGGEAELILPALSQGTGPMTIVSFG
jgi:hypothetical protein